MIMASTAISTGLTPEIRAACASVSGRNRLSFSLIDLLMHDTNDFLANYKGRIEEISETRIDYNEDGYGFYPDDYFCLFYRFDWGKKKICRFKDHEKRRNRLYIDACIMRRIKPDASFMELLYNLVVRRQRYYDNSDGVLTNRFLIEKVNQVLAMDISDL